MPCPSPHPEDATCHLSPRQEGHQGLRLLLIFPASGEQRRPFPPPREWGHPVSPCRAMGDVAWGPWGLRGPWGLQAAGAEQLSGLKLRWRLGAGSEARRGTGSPWWCPRLGSPLLSHPEGPAGRRAGPRQAGRMQDRPGLRIALGWEEEEGWGFLCDASSSSYPALPGSTCDTGTLRVPPAPPLSRTPIPNVTARAGGCTPVSPGAPTVPAARTSATPTVPCRCHPPLLSGPITAVTPRRCHSPPPPRFVALHFLINLGALPRRG